METKPAIGTVVVAAAAATTASTSTTACHARASPAGAGRHVKLSELNEFISCPMCHGYLIDATTVSECLHTFCKSCIVKHIKGDNNECPKCNTIIHEQRPMDYILHDRSKQDIVYKLVPQLYINELMRKLAVQDLQEIDPYTRLGLKKKFIYVALVHQKRKKRNHFTLIDQARSMHSTSDAPSSSESTDTTSSNHTANQSLSNSDSNNNNHNNHSSSSSNNNNNNNNHNNNGNDHENDHDHIYLRCPFDVRVSQIRKLLAVKYQLVANDRLVLLYKGDIISDNDQVSNLAQSVSFVIHYEISKVYHPSLGGPVASTSSDATLSDSDMMSTDEIK